MLNDLDYLQMYFGDPITINQWITLYQPKIDDVIKLGEKRYYQVINTLTAIPSDMKPQLWDMGICWEDIDDFTLFAMSAPTLKVEDTHMLFGDLDFSKFRLGENTRNHLPVLFQLVYDSQDNLIYDSEGKPECIVIDEYIYQLLMKLLRTMHNITPKREKAGSKWVRDYLIQKQRDEIEEQSKKEYSSFLLPLISSMLNSPEFKFSLNEIKQMPYFTFMDSVKRVQLIRNSTALLYGCYGGFIDTSKIDKKELDWMIDFSKQEKKKRKNGVMGL